MAFKEGTLGCVHVSIWRVRHGITPLLRFYDQKSPFVLMEVQKSCHLPFPMFTMALDRMLGEVIESANADHICLCSDHGFGGAGIHAVYLNRFLESRGWLKYKKRALFSPVLDSSKIFLQNICHRLYRVKYIVIYHNV